MNDPYDERETCPHCGSDDLYYELESIFARIPDDPSEPIEFAGGDTIDGAAKEAVCGRRQCGACFSVIEFYETLPELELNSV